jgi:hypothetical protein
MNKKGQINFTTAPSIALTFVLIGLFIAAGVIAINAMKNGQGFYTQVTNSSVNSTIDSSITGLSNLSAQMPTVGQMVGIALILTVILGVFAFGVMKKGGGGL